MNPYDSPNTMSRPVPRSDATNPAKPLLALIGGLYAACSPLAFVSGLQAGIHLIIASAMMLVLSIGTIWLAFRDFTPSYRITTIVWGACLSAFFAYAAAAAFDPADYGGFVFFLFVLVIVVPIPVLAAIRQPTDGANQTSEL